MNRRTVLKSAAAAVVAPKSISKTKEAKTKRLPGTYKICVLCDNCGSRFGPVKIPKGISADNFLAHKKCPQCEITDSVRMSHGSRDFSTLDWETGKPYGE